jgi:hypothetical protein
MGTNRGSELMAGTRVTVTIQAGESTLTLVKELKVKYAMVKVVEAATAALDRGVYLLDPIVVDVDL